MVKKNETTSENIDEEQDKKSSFIQEKYRIDLAGRMFTYVASPKIQIGRAHV